MNTVSSFNFARETPPLPPLPAMPAVDQLLPDQPDQSHRVLLVSDIHANWPALEAVLRHARGNYDTIWFLGDVVGYGPYPVECVLFVQNYLSPHQWRAGNHDLGVLDRMEGFVWSGTAKYTLDIHKAALMGAPQQWEWMQEVMTVERCGPIVKNDGAGQQVLTHANLENDLSVYLFPSNTEKTRSNIWKLREYLSVVDRTGWLLAGHSHIPCLFHISPTEADYTKARPCSIVWGEPTPVHDGHYYINPGSVGQPRDGDARPCYLILDLDALTATWYRTSYDSNDLIARYYQYYANPYRTQLLQMLKDGGTARTVQELLPFYRIEQRGLITT